MSERREIVVLSDLHLGARRPRLDAPDAFADDEALTALLEHLGARPATEEASLRLVLLGDVVDFVLVGAGESVYDRSADAAGRDLDAIAAAHGAVLGALGRLASTPGVDVQIVPGNHDMELALPAVTARLSSLAAAAAGRPAGDLALLLAPWIVHVPGVLHAEHGQQHHDLNRFADLAGLPRAGGDALRRPPPAAYLDALLAARQAGGGRLAGAAARMAPRLAASAWALGRRREPLSGRDHGDLPSPLLDELDNASAVGALDVARRLARRTLWRRAGAPALDLGPAAARTHSILARHGHAVPFVVFGHTHAPLDEPLGAGARHLNTGTWSNLGPGAGQRTVVRVVEDQDGPHARLERWEPDRGELVPWR